MRHIDLLRTVKANFRLPHNKLQYVAKHLGVGEKIKHEGFELWLKVMVGDPEAWEVMQAYNKQDVILLEAVFNKLLPWLKGSQVTNQSLALDDHVCSRCGSEELEESGEHLTATVAYTRFQCRACGSWSRAGSRPDTPLVPI
jgi:hypothetical protein